MDIIYHIEFESGAVFLLNGSFVESAQRVVYRKGEPLYITVLPLEAIYLPYTVKISDFVAITNGALCDCFNLGEQRCLVRLKPRYNYVYTPERPLAAAEPTGIVPNFFRHVKDKRFALARDCMTRELSASVDDEALGGFFADFDELAENVYTSAKGWLLLRQVGESSVCEIKIRSGLIDNFEIT